MRVIVISLFFITPVFAESLTHSGIAREKGINYLLLTIKIGHFAHMVSQVQDPHAFGFMAGASGIDWDANGQDLALRYDFGLKPLLNQQTGMWAHNLISNGDHIGGGVRSTTWNSYKIGLIFPTSVLDESSFRVDDLGTAASRRLRMEVGVGGRSSYNSEKDDIEKLGEVLDRLIALAPSRSRVGENRFDTGASTHFRIDLNSRLSPSQAHALWIPQPTLQWTADRPQQFLNADPNKMTYELDPEYNSPATHIRISRVDDSGEWHDTPLPGPRPDERFDAKSKVGNWYSVVPDWKNVEQQLRDVGVTCGSATAQLVRRNKLFPPPGDGFGRR